MEINFITTDRGKRMLEINDARIIFKNFSGAPTKVNPRGGEISFSVVIPNQEMAEELSNDINELGAGWNVRLREPREEGDEPLYHLPVKVRFNNWGPIVQLISNGNKIELDEESIGMLDDVVIGKVNLDLRPYDDEGQFGPFRSAYLSGMRAYQVVTNRFANDDY